MKQDQSGNSFKRVDGKFDCYVEVLGNSSFNGKKALPEDSPKFDLPL